VGVLGLVTLLTNVVIGTLCWFTFLLPRTQRDLCRYGRTAVGTVIRNEALGSGTPTYIVHYRFEPRPDKVDGLQRKTIESQHERAKGRIGGARRDARSESSGRIWKRETD